MENKTGKCLKHKSLPGRDLREIAINSKDVVPSDLIMVTADRINFCWRKEAFAYKHAKSYQWGDYYPCLYCVQNNQFVIQIIDLN